MSRHYQRPAASRGRRLTELDHRIDAVLDLLADAYFSLRPAASGHDVPLQEGLEARRNLARAGRLLRLGGEVDLRLREPVDIDVSFWESTGGEAER